MIMTTPLPWLFRMEPFTQHFLHLQIDRYRLVVRLRPLYYWNHWSFGLFFIFYVLLYKLTELLVKSFQIKQQMNVYNKATLLKPVFFKGGHFDLADRMFHSIGEAWESSSKNNMADVRELIPEFFYLPDFLTNKNNFDLGRILK